MEQQIAFVGIDISKTTLDICIVTDDLVESYKIDNTKTKIHYFFKTQLKGSLAVVACENTGDYGELLSDVMTKLQLEYYVINPLHLSKSLGLTRGKSDKIDAIRIATFLRKNRDELQPFEQLSDAIKSLKLLFTERLSCIKQRAKLRQRMRRLKRKDKTIVAFLIQSNKKMISEIGKQIKSIEVAMAKVINGDKALKKTFICMKSIPGVGDVLSWQILCKTNGFRIINSARKLACFAGVAPFGFSSGSSIKRRNKVSYYADKKLKATLQMCAMRTVRMNNEMADYYHRKVAEGKSKMLVLNAVRNKLIHRIYAVVKNQRMYQPT